MTYGVGVDLGTTFTAAAVRRTDGQVEMTTLGRGAFAVPSALYALVEGGFLVGEVAMDRGRLDPGRLAVEFKRRLGDSAPILLGGTAYSADRLTAELLRWTLGVVAERQGAPAERVVVTCPANWGDFRRDMLRGALSLAGVPDASVITEPEGAALHYAAREGVEPGELVAVYDLGGGTFDAVVLERTDSGFVTRGMPHGIERLGGVDLDHIIRGMVIEHLTTDLTSLDLSDPSVAADLFDLQAQCVQAKMALSSDLATTVRVRLADERADIRLTRTEFEQRAAPTLQASVEALEQTIRGAGATPADISKILLVGGSSRIPLISEMVFEELGRPVAVDTDPKAAVAMGAAQVATADPGRLASPPVPADSGGESAPSRSGTLAPPPETLPPPPESAPPPPPETLPTPPESAPPPETLPPPPVTPPPPEPEPPPLPSDTPPPPPPETPPPVPPPLPRDHPTPPLAETATPPGPTEPVVVDETTIPPHTPFPPAESGTEDAAPAAERTGVRPGVRAVIGAVVVAAVLAAIVLFVTRGGDPEDGDLAAEDPEDSEDGEDPEDEQTPEVEPRQFADLHIAGETVFPFGTEIGGQQFTSISGIAFDPNTEIHLGVRGNTNRPDPDLAELAPVLYSFRISATGDVQLIDAVSLTGPNGEPYGLELDAEGLEVLDDGTVMVMSEGQPGDEAELFLNRHDRDGSFLQSFAIPDTYVPSADRGIGSGGFDALTLVRDRDLLIAGIEYPLLQDDTPGPLDDKTVRLLGFDSESGEAVREWGYPLDKVNAGHPDPSAVQGALLALIAVDDRTVLAWERSFAVPGAEPIFALYQVELTEGVEPSDQLPPVLEKRLVWADTNRELTENYDSAALGVPTAEGETTVVLAADCRYRVCDTSILTVALDERE